MAGKSSIDTLPVDLREAIDRVIRDGRLTIDEIVGYLQSIVPEGVELPSRSAIGRYSKRMKDAMGAYREAQEVAGVWVQKLGENPKGDVGQLLGELLKTVAFQTIGSMSEDPDNKGVDAQDLMFLARAIKDLGSFDRIKFDLAVKLREQASKVIDRVAAEVEKNPEMDRAAMLKRIREEIYGVFE